MGYECRLLLLKVSVQVAEKVFSIIFAKVSLSESSSTASLD